MNIEQIKANKTCLDYLGKPLKRTSSGWHIYRCPWRMDTHPSLTVSPDGKVWRDLATGAEGGIIELVMASLDTRDFREVCAVFDSSSFLPPKNLDIKKEKEMSSSGFDSFSIVPLQSRGLYAYLHQRSIDISTAKQFLLEAHYSFQQRVDGRYLYALAYANDKGGYELRSSGYKGSTSPKGITTHLTVENAPVVVFEGFMDMLSFATMCGGVKHNYVTLNSIVNAPAATDILNGYVGTIYLCLDNDKGGDDATAFLLDALPSSIDIRRRFAPAKDVNEYLMKMKKGTK